MSSRSLASLVVALLAALAFYACDEDAPVAPDPAHHMTAGVTALVPDPFTFRAPLDPFTIRQLPNFTIQSNARSDIVIQRLVFANGPGPWHTHPGPSFVYVIEGKIKVERFTKEGSCTETPVFVAGNAYFEVANEVHRAVVVSDRPAVILVTRFNIPVGAPFTIMVADPGC